jgi:streptogramin lyase
MFDARLRFGSLVCTLAATMVCGCGDDDTGRGESQGEGVNSLSFGDTLDTTGDGDGDGDGDPSGDGDGDPTGDGDSDPCQGGTDIEGFIWIANSGEGTVSKIDTTTGVELGRYIARPDSAGSPSRTSVNNRGDVAVANRLGGVTMIRANESDCVDTNGVPGIQTSTGAGDVLAWGQDECVAWHTPIPHGDNRPVAWTSGFADPDSCEYYDRDVWTSWSDGAAGTAVVALLDGDTGEIIEQIPIPTLPESWPGWFGFYGGAVDKDDNFWISQLQGGLLVKVNRSDFGVTSYAVPEEGGYGMTVTPDGYVWLCGRFTHRLEPNSGTWTSVNHYVEPDSIHTGGCMGDGESLLWRGGYNQIIALDTQTLAVVKQIPVTQVDDDFIWGVAIDFDGFVWAVPRNGTRAYKVSPLTDSVVLTVEGLVAAYTYSDMTGFALSGVGAIP